MIVEDTRNKKDNTIGIAVSGKQSGIFYKITNDDFFESPLHRPSGDYATELGHGRVIFERGHAIYAGFMGHTALFCRIDGVRQTPVIGFFPDQTGAVLGLSLTNMKARKGKAVNGAWHNDNWMFYDDAALAYEIPVSRTKAVNMNDLLKEKLDAPSTKFKYQIKQNPYGPDADRDTAARNCVAGVIVLLEEFRDTYLAAAEQGSKDHMANQEIVRIVTSMIHFLGEKEFKQGYMQQLLQTGFVHLPVKETETV